MFRNNSEFDYSFEFGSHCEFELREEKRWLSNFWYQHFTRAIINDAKLKLPQPASELLDSFFLLIVMMAQVEVKSILNDFPTFLLLDQLRH